MPAVSLEALVVFLREKGRWIEASGASISEAALGPQLIYPLAARLGWATEDGELRPEERVGAQDRADYSLVAKDPRSGREEGFVVIETKKPSVVLGPQDEDQLGKYIGRVSARIAALTNGRVWRLYLISATGVIAEKRFVEVDIVADCEEAARVFGSYLSRDRLVGNDLAARSASEMHARQSDQAHWREELPIVVQRLLNEPTDALLRLIGDEASHDGRRPTVETLQDYLVGVGGRCRDALFPPRGPRSTTTPGQGSVHGGAGSGTTRSPAKYDLPSKGMKPRELVIGGTRVPVKTWADLLSEAAKYAQQKGRLPIPFARPGQRPLIAEQLHHFNPKYQGRAVPLPLGGYLDVNYSAPDCVECARAILQAAGLDPSQLGYTLRDP
jgi:hypothetical protein